jgi:hypothetical protein
MNSEHPLITSKSFGDHGAPLLLLASYFPIRPRKIFGTIPKIMFLLKRGADIQTQGEDGWNCLHFILSQHRLWKRLEIRNEVYNDQEFHFILMAFVTAGVDVKAVDHYGFTPSDYAYAHGHEDVWIQVLAECGYDPWEVFTLENKNFYAYTGMSCFSTAKIRVRPTKMSFEEFSSHLGPLEAFGVPKPDADWWEERATAICGMDGSETDSECWSDDVSEFETAFCDDCCKNIDANHLWGTDYMPINGDFTWLAYIRRHKFLWYWPKDDALGLFSESVDSSDDDDEYDSDDDEYDSDDDEYMNPMIGLEDDSSSESEAKGKDGVQGWKEGE